MVPACFFVCPCNRCWVAALLEDRDEVLLLRVDWATRTLQVAGWHTLEGLHMPTQLAFGPCNRYGVAASNRAAGVRAWYFSHIVAGLA